ncbi:endopeptidase La [Desulfosoma caldarium]|uniref:Lon protease n=1 Tax=Desulfosoma caldarium TaxID=610254 RepID=A0A3N1VUS8_9BACT|nr:endopeptidase La [Desulfosoma caldarium]ROR03537.1 ATP-dependent Lon protease [Desulfosoma caldarium]
MSKPSWPTNLPVLPLRHTMLFPAMILPLFLSEANEKAVLAEAEKTGRYIFLATCCGEDSTCGRGGPGEPSWKGALGCVALILKTTLLEDGRIKILVQGIAKARVLSVMASSSGLMVRLEPLVETDMPLDASLLPLLSRVRQMGLKLFTLRGMHAADAEAVLHGIASAGRLADFLAMNLHLDPHECCRLMGLVDPSERLRAVAEALGEELQKAEVQQEIESEAETALRRRQRERYLREQLKAIRRELGEWDENKEEWVYREKIRAAGMSPEAFQVAMRELDRLLMMQSDSAEASLVRTYLDWLIEMPWRRTTEDRLDLAEAAKVLDADHHDMETIKEHILDFLGACSLKGSLKGSILCLVGPPGVGKTSLGRSIAKAMGRRFVRLSLGGVRDEAEIRGHRRTYLGALPGRIIQGLRYAGTKNPVFMLDEIDKIGSDARGDPAAALLEVLDPEQNKAFSDHYLNVAFDLSQVLFIATANSLEHVPPALVDRMEVLTLTGYTDREKLVIAKSYLLPRQLEEHGLQPEDLALSDSTLMALVRRYTRESGVRQLERAIGTLCRKAARHRAEGGRAPFRVFVKNLERLLGPPLKDLSSQQFPSIPGVALALAWTPHGGEVLRIEAAVMTGKGAVVLTGHLGTIMKESAQAALSFIRTRAGRWGLPSDFHEKMDVHIHVPAGAVPKDGPSAGMALCAALVSALLQKPLGKPCAMTGEISLLGDVLPVGGFREKALAAARSGLRLVFVPQGNMDDVAQLPAYVTRAVNFIPSSHMDQVLEHLFGADKGAACA